MALFSGPTVACTEISAPAPTVLANIFNLALLALVRVDEDRSNLIFELAVTLAGVTIGAAEVEGVGVGVAVGVGAGVDEKARIGITEFVAGEFIPKYLDIPPSCLKKFS